MGKARKLYGRAQYEVRKRVVTRVTVRRVRCTRWEHVDWCDTYDEAAETACRESDTDYDGGSKTDVAEAMVFLRGYALWEEGGQAWKGVMAIRMWRKRLWGSR